MTTPATALPNSEGKLDRLQAGRITGTWPVIVVFARLVLATLVGTSIAGLYALRGSPTPWQDAAPWWVVYGTLIDVGCLALLAWLTRREGIRLFDLIGFERKRLGRDLLLGLGFIVLLFALFMLGGVGRISLCVQPTHRDRTSYHLLANTPSAAIHHCPLGHEPGVDRDASRAAAGGPLGCRDRAL